MLWSTLSVTSVAETTMEASSVSVPAPSAVAVVDITPATVVSVAGCGGATVVDISPAKAVRLSVRISKEVV